MPITFPTIPFIIKLQNRKIQKHAIENIQKQNLKFIMDGKSFSLMDQIEGKAPEPIEEVEEIKEVKPKKVVKKLKKVEEKKKIKRRATTRRRIGKKK